MSLSFSFSLSHLTLLQIAPHLIVGIASRSGYDFVGLRLLPSGVGGIAYPLMSDKAMMRDTRARLADTGIRVFDIESVSLNPTTAADDYLPLFQAGADLGARTVIASGFDPDPQRTADNFAAVCESAAGFGLLIHLEFIPWSSVRTPSDARTLVESSRQPNARVLLDVLHLDRSGGTVQELSGLSGAMDYFHVCDAPKLDHGGDEDMIHTARFARLLPGDGDIDLQPVIEAAPTDSVIGIEVPSTELMHRLGAEELARRGLLATKNLIAAHVRSP
ncbi:xylose isomerase domain-containing protein [Rhizobium etli bv. mimosae str. IE4771]|uniref:Xylose isomerase domain-containing protein n=1 Tax=Rhizobium etli bv. mimosae str. IE4771 TaxID=1432050 RepID=A0A060I125_RHIET|nr:xylose isomerase domain-containing protein [Rhizobium sp. IE4771]